MHVLVVDDDEMVRYVLNEKLSEIGYTVTDACDGQSALELFLDTGFDAVLLDLKMPGMDGITTLREMRKHDPDVPVIMVTAFGDISTAVEAIKLGAYDFVEKPPQLSRIMVMLKRAIEKAALEREVRSLAKNAEDTVVLKAACEKLQELDKMKTAFLSSISHELRTPLTSIIGYAEIARQKYCKLLPSITPKDQKLSRVIGQIDANLDILVSEANRLACLIDNVLELTALEAGTVDVCSDDVALESVINNVATGFVEQFKSRGLDFSWVIEADLPHVVGDSRRLSHVMDHLFANAFKFTEQGHVSCSVRKVQGNLLVSVSDTGKGIPEELHRAIFDKFSQIGETLTDKPHGTGLGLPICRLIVERHGGTIWVESEPGKGSTFTFSLPAVQKFRS
jgi:signal transduction histidine kinase